MRKFFLSLSVVVVVLVGFMGCSQQKQWNREQRQALRQMLRDYREMVYLENLTEAEYMLFADEVAAAIENIEKKFAGNGRVLIRPSGTEPLVRVMLEGSDMDELTADATELAQLMERKFG